MKVTFQIEGATPVIIECNAGENLLELARRANVAIDAPCSGNGSCGKCRVKLVEGELDTIKSRHISDEEFEAGWRLSCNSKVKGDCTVFVPDIASAYQSRMKTADLSSPAEIAIFENCQKEMQENGIEFTNSFRCLELTMSEPTLDDTMPDNERLTWAIEEALGVEKVTIPFVVMVRLASTLRQNHFHVCVKGALKGDTFHCMEICGPEDKAIVGCAIDIGTTTVTMVLTDLETGKILAKGSSGNGQIRFGADVINRIIEQGRPGGKAKLQNAIVKETLSPIIANLCKTAKVSARSILHLAIGANTTMNHLLVGADGESIRMEPYIPSFFHWDGLLGGDLKLPVNPLASVIIAPNIGSYVGGDITAGTLASGIWNREEMSLFIDLGTNGELVFGNRDFMMSCAYIGADVGSNGHRGQGVGRQVQVTGHHAVPAEEAGDIGLHPDGLGVHAHQQVIHGGVGTDGQAENAPGIDLCAAAQAGDQGHQSLLDDGVLELLLAACTALLNDSIDDVGTEPDLTVAGGGFGKQVAADQIHQHHGHGGGTDIDGTACDHRILRRADLHHMEGVPSQGTLNAHFKVVFPEGGCHLHHDLKGNGDMLHTYGLFHRPGQPLHVGHGVVQGGLGHLHHHTAVVVGKRQAAFLQLLLAVGKDLNFLGTAQVGSLHSGLVSAGNIGHQYGHITGHLGAAAQSPAILPLLVGDMAALDRIQLAFQKLHTAFAAGTVTGTGRINGHIGTPCQFQQVFACIAVNQYRGCPFNLECNFHIRKSSLNIHRQKSSGVRNSIVRASDPCFCQQVPLPFRCLPMPVPFRCSEDPAPCDRSSQSPPSGSSTSGGIGIRLLFWRCRPSRSGPETRARSRQQRLQTDSLALPPPGRSCRCEKSVGRFFPACTGHRHGAVDFFQKVRSLRCPGQQSHFPGLTGNQNAKWPGGSFPPGHIRRDHKVMKALALSTVSLCRFRYRNYRSR